MSCGGSSGLFGISFDFFGSGGGGGGGGMMTDELGDAIGVDLGDAPGAGAIGVEVVTGLGFGLGIEGEAGTVVGGVGIGTEFVRCADAADVIIVQVTIAKITRLTRSIFIFPSYPFPFTPSPFP